MKILPGLILMENAAHRMVQALRHHRAIHWATPVADRLSPVTERPV
jgi:hypothetical protein